MNRLVLVLALLLPVQLDADGPRKTSDPATVKLDAKSQYDRDAKISMKVDGLDKVKARLKWWVRSTEGKASPEVEITNNTCLIWAGPGQYEVLITIGVVDGQEINWIDLEHKFAVGSTTPPEPVVPVVPVSDFTAKIKEIVDPVRDDNKAEAVKIIAKAFLDQSKETFTTPEQLADATSSQFVYELGLNRYLRWRPAMTRLREHYATLLKEGKLRTMQDWTVLWVQYAKAFEEYK